MVRVNVVISYKYNIFPEIYTLRGPILWQSTGFGGSQHITYQRLTTYACSPFAAGILPNPLNPKALPAILFPAAPQAKIQKPSIYFAISENSNTFALPIGRTILPPARMAESVDALVSNTSGAIRAGSIPAPGTSKRLSITLGLLLVPLLNPSQLR